MGGVPRKNILIIKYFWDNFTQYYEKFMRMANTL